MAVVTLAATLIFSVSPAGAWPAPPTHRAACTRRPVPALCRLHWWIRATRRAEHVRSMARTRYWYSAERNPSAAPWILRRQAWRARTRRIQAIPLAPWPPWWRSDILCIHRGEGAWNDPGAPYWGGLQMNLGFMETYGSAFLARYGTADHWPPVDQITAAWRAYQSRGFTPWPNTAAMCGLL